MYRTEVPLYGDLVEIVQSVDDAVLQSRCRINKTSSSTAEDLPTRHRLERHGAIRLGTQHEMRMISRLFAVLGMFPVGYYDLSKAPGGGFPLHGTAFRPTSEESLRKNPFRVFTTVLRPDLIKSDEVRETAQRVLAGRELFTPLLGQLLDRFDSTNNRSTLSAADADTLISESLKIFKWHSRSTTGVTLETYTRLKNEHPIVADIVCFPSAHINHLTPRTLDIDAVQEEMIRRGLPAKERIEGPPPGRKCEILLRQTSFKALEERVLFSGSRSSSFASTSSGSERLNVGGAVGDEGEIDGTHTARFGEVEQRGAAVTLRGRRLYDELLAEAASEVNNMGASTGADLDALHTTILSQKFKERYPDDWTESRKQGLVFFRYRVVPGRGIKDGRNGGAIKMEDLLEQGIVECKPITYEDFLPFSAVGIFKSNLGDRGESVAMAVRLPEKSDAEYEAARTELESLLGRQIPSEIDLYEGLQSASVRECEGLLGLRDEQIEL